MVDLSDSEGRSVRDASAADLTRALSDLQADPEQFVIVERGPDAFMQARHPQTDRGRPPLDQVFQLEYKNEPGSVMNLAVSYEFEEIERTVLEYAEGSDSWLERFRWWPFDIDDRAMDAEAPASVFAAAAQLIAHEMKPFGFRRIKRDRRLQRDRGPWTDSIWMHTGSGNRRGHQAVITLSLSVGHVELASWRSGKPGVGSGHVDQQQLGYVMPTGPRQARWNLVGSFELAVADLVYSLTHFALAYFDCFDDDLTFPERTRALRSSRLDYIETLELFVALDRIDLVGPYLTWLGTDHPQALQMAKHRRRQLTATTVPGRGSGYEQLADVLHENDLLDHLPE